MEADKWMQYKTKLTFIEEIEVTLPAVADNRIEIAQRMPQQIEVIYGISAVLGGVTPDNQNIIVPGQDELLYLTLFDRTKKFVDRFRLDQLVFSQDCEQKYLPVWVEGSIDLDRSEILNPTGILDNTIVLYFWYVPKMMERMNEPKQG